jgi:hypothetical protein
MDVAEDAERVIENRRDRTPSRGIAKPNLTTETRSIRAQTSRLSIGNRQAKYLRFVGLWNSDLLANPMPISQNL